jgi:hypothetical protein
MRDCYAIAASQLFYAGSGWGDSNPCSTRHLLPFRVLACSNSLRQQSGLKSLLK